MKKQGGNGKGKESGALKAEVKAQNGLTAEQVLTCQKNLETEKNSLKKVLENEGLSKSERLHYEGKLTLVNQVLRMIRQGTFGKCVGDSDECQVTIPPELLLEDPCTYYCENCEAGC